MAGDRGHWGRLPSEWFLGINSMPNPKAEESKVRTLVIRTACPRSSQSRYPSPHLSDMAKLALAPGDSRFLIK